MSNSPHPSSEILKGGFLKAVPMSAAAVDPFPTFSCKVDHLYRPVFNGLTRTEGYLKRRGGDVL